MSSLINNFLTVVLALYLAIIGNNRLHTEYKLAVAMDKNMSDDKKKDLRTNLLKLAKRERFFLRLITLLLIIAFVFSVLEYYKVICI